ncbi:hypothetical protein WJX74_007926 [Apatococcus lobatus]|uniref:Uncharacterized protein n=1 Tax=Apatococcus lobatus TaxID=904363 RepID=A0AAW1SGW1_9CHLO
MVIGVPVKAWTAQVSWFPSLNISSLELPAITQDSPDNEASLNVEACQRFCKQINSGCRRGTPGKSQGLPIYKAGEFILDSRCILWQDSVKQLLEQSSVDAASLLAQDQTWTPVLAIGSNAGPSQLARKFPAKLFPHGVLIPALRAVLPDFDVVYAPLVSSYGSATATLEYSPGTKVAVYVTFLTPDLLERMDATEGAYFLCELFNINLRLGISLQDFGLGKQAPESLKFIFQYNHQHGTPHFPILLDGQAAATSPIAIQEIPAADRRFPTLSQTQMQRALKYLFQNRKGNTFPALPVAHDAHHSECQEGWKEASEDDLDTWILENLDDSVKRGAIVDALTAIARPFGWESSKIMRTLGDRYAANVA